MNQQQIKELLENEEMEVNESLYLKQLIEMEQITLLTFGDALEALKENKKVAREGWNGKGMYLQLQKVDSNSKMQHDYIYMSDVNKKLFPWNPNNLDMLAEDWTILNN